MTCAVAAERTMRVKPQHRIDVGGKRVEIELAGVGEITRGQRVGNRLRFVPQFESAFERAGFVLCPVRYAFEHVIGQIHILADPAVRAAAEAMVMTVAVELAAWRLVLMERTVDLLAIEALHVTGETGKTVVQMRRGLVGLVCK